MILLNTARSAACDAVVDLLDGGSGAGYIELQTSGGVEVATLPLSATAFGAASNGVATAATITNDTNATGGTVAKAAFFDSDDAKHFTMSVGTSGAEIIISSVTIAASETVAITSCTVTCPAGT